MGRFVISLGIFGLSAGVGVVAGSYLDTKLADKIAKSETARTVQRVSLQVISGGVIYALASAAVGGATRPPA